MPGIVLARVQRDGDALAAEFAEPREDAIRLAHRQRADHHARRAGIEDRGHVVARAHATAGLHLQARRRGDPRSNGASV
jgi:hypothetical protein